MRPQFQPKVISPQFLPKAQRQQTNYRHSTSQRHSDSAYLPTVIDEVIAWASGPSAANTFRSTMNHRTPSLWPDHTWPAIFYRVVVCPGIVDTSMRYLCPRYASVKVQHLSCHLPVCWHHRTCRLPCLSRTSPWDTSPQHIFYAHRHWDTPPHLLSHFALSEFLPSVN